MKAVRADTLRSGDTILVRRVPHSPGHFDEVRIRSVEATTAVVRTESGRAVEVPAVRVNMAAGWWTVYTAAEGVALVARGAP